MEQRNESEKEREKGGEIVSQSDPGRRDGGATISRRTIRGFLLIYIVFRVLE